MSDKAELRIEELQSRPIKKLRKFLIKRRDEHRVRLGNGRTLTLEEMRIVQGSISAATKLIDDLDPKADPTIANESDDPDTIDEILDSDKEDERIPDIGMAPS